MDTFLARADADQLARFRLRCGELRRPSGLRQASERASELDSDESPGLHGPQYLTEIDDMNRRELLQLLSVSSAALATSIDWDRVVESDDLERRIEIATTDQYAAMNQLLWQEYSSAPTKAAALPAVREHLRVVVSGLCRPDSDSVRRRLCELAAEVSQLAGEILFDDDRYPEAAYCYTVAASLSKEASAWDLWACALTRQAYISIHDNYFPAAVTLAESARQIARRGDHALTTRYWVDAVHARALAGLGDYAGWERATDSAEGVLSMSHLGSNGWLRFDGDRLAEERATCLVQLDQPDRAEQILDDVLNNWLSSRRRASVLVDLAAVGAVKRDPLQAVMYGDAALDLARQTRSGYIGRRLENLRRRLAPLGDDRHVEHLDRQIVALSQNHANQSEESRAGIRPRSRLPTGMDRRSEGSLPR
ncbi:transcriptional regulator [Nocardia amamiensis]|uniref:transcriptional regulator n=1 Tax=Nocardia amamiensis TaxID=404578 RepID=UPI00157D796F|nr:transcriptional regulator [Nocardia amamiensis]